MSNPDSDDVYQVAERYLRSRLDSHRDRVQHQEQVTVPSLLSLTADRIMQDLEESEEVDAAVSQLVGWLDPIPLRQVLENPKASYRLLRAFHNSRDDTGQRAIDLDEAIIRNECYLRSRCNTDGAYLVSLEDFADSYKTLDKSHCHDFNRKEWAKESKYFRHGSKHTSYEIAIILSPCDNCGGHSLGDLLTK